MSRQHDRARHIAEQVIREMIDDIRIEDIRRTTNLTGELLNLVSEHIAAAKVQIKWAR